MTDDTESLEYRAARALKRFELEVNRRDIPERFVPLVDCLLGALRQQIRLGREIDTLRLGGNIRVDVTVDPLGHAVESL